MKILDGKLISQEILQDISEQIEGLSRAGKRIPRLDMILVGDDYGSLKYVNMKKNAAKKAGMLGWIHHLPKTVNTMDVVNLIDSLNSDPEIDGFMVQMPLPDHINTRIVLESIDPRKDIDGLTAVNLGKLYHKDHNAFAPATPLGIMRLLEEYNIKVFRKKVVIIGASNIVGVPLSAMMLAKNATVSICNEHTTDLMDMTKTADILISATGQPLLITKEHIKEGCVVVDVGSNSHPETGKLVGDVDWDSVYGVPSYITPVPGGVGPMTIASLMQNLMWAYNSKDKRAV